MRILHTADLHGGLTRYGHLQADGRNSRVADFIAALEHFVETAIREQVDVAVLAGDLTHTRRPGPTELQAIASACARLEAAGIEVILIPGNHDGPATIHDAATHTHGWLREITAHDRRIHVYTEPGIAHVGDMAVVTVPYPHKRSLDALLPSGTPDDQRTEAASRAVESVIETLAARMNDSTFRLFVGHLSVAGARLGTETAMRWGWDVMIRPEVLAPFDYAALGHIHRRQQVGPRAWYAGSPQSIDFGDDDQDKGYNLVDITYDPTTNTTDTSVRLIPSPARPLVTLDGDRPDIDAAVLARAPIVRLRYEAERPSPATVDATVRALRSAGASYVKVDITGAEIAATPDQEARRAIAGLSTSDALGRWLELAHVDEQYRADIIAAAARIAGEAEPMV